MPIQKQYVNYLKAETSENDKHINNSENDINQRKIKNNKLFNKLKNLWPLSKTTGRIFLIYLIVVLIGGFLLSIPGVTTEDEYNWDFLTGVFTASSAFSDTGIIIITPSTGYSFWGHLIIIILIELGGFGILTVKIVIYVLLERRVSIYDTQVARIERGSWSNASTIEIIKDGFIWLTVVQIFAAILLFFAFFFTEPIVIEEFKTVSSYHNFEKSIWFAIFHSTSAINNAGFDLISNNSLVPYNAIGHRGYMIQTIFLLEWMIGGLGYPTFHDIKRKIKAKRRGESVRFSLFTKLNFVVQVSLFVIGPLLIFMSEYTDSNSSVIFQTDILTGELLMDDNGNFIQNSGGVIFMDILFNSMSTRNAGFWTINPNQFNAASRAMMSILMFIGAAPSSTSGGIRTTTFAILLLATWAIVRNNKQTTAFKKTIPESTVKQSFAVFFVSILMVILVAYIIFLDSGKAISNNTDDSLTVIQLLMLVTSCYGTNGLNPLTEPQMLSLGILSKILMMLLMFIGQLGVSNTLLVFVKPQTKKMYSYLEENVVIG